LYQLKAHLEEQKALQDLGTMVSAAENLPTLKLANLQELAAQGAMGAQRDTTVVPPPVARPAAGEGSVAAVPPPPPLEDVHEYEATTAAPDLGVDTIPPSRMPSDELPPLPPPTAVARATPAAAPHDWKKMAKAEVNPQWFWRVVMGVAGLAVLILAIVGIRAAMASRPSVKRDASFEQEVRERQAALKEV